MAWIRLLAGLIDATRFQQIGKEYRELPDWKYRMVGLKLWGLAIGAFQPEQAASQGAQIHIHTQDSAAPESKRLDLPRRPISAGQRAMQAIPMYQVGADVPEESAEDRMRRIRMEEAAKRFIRNTK